MKNSRHFPDYHTLIFQQNKKRPDIYDLVNNRFKKFKYFRLSAPRSNMFRKQGAKYIIESWDKGIKTLFSGLIQVKDNYYYGDQYNPKNGKKSTLIVRIETTGIVIYYFNSFSLFPKYRNQFIIDFIRQING